MTDVLLINSTEDVTRKTASRANFKSHKEFVAAQKADGLAMAQTPHIGLAYLLAIVHKHGIDGHVIDMAADGMTMADILTYVDEHKPSIIGFSAFTIQVKSAAIIAERIKDKHPDIFICLGGAHATAMPVEALQEFPAFDATIPGEAELPWSELLYNPENASNIPGIVTRDNQETQYVNKTAHDTPPKQIARILDLDSVLFPHWEGFNLSHFSGDCPHRTKLELPMSTSRGCPYACNFCSRMFGRKRVYRSVDSVIEEMWRNVTDFGAEAISFLDETFVANKKFSEKLFLRMISEDLHKRVKWSCETTVHLNDLSYYRLMKEAGCYYVFYGFESANEEMLKRIGKGVKNKSQIVNAVQAAADAGICCVGSFILGLPGETRETVMETIELSKQISTNVYSVTFPIAVPFPGSAARSFAEKGEYGLRILTNNWDDYGKQFPGVMESEHLKINELRDLQKLAYDVNPKKNLDEFLTLRTQQA